MRKALIELPDFDRPTMLAQAFRHAPVVVVAAGGRIEPSGDDKHD
jgi:hypothetical protein